MNKNSEFPIHFQRAVLARVLQDDKFNKAAVRRIKVEHFDTEPFRWICRRILNNNVSTIPILINELKIEKKKEKIKDDLRIAIRDEIKLFIRNVNFDDAKYGLDKLDEFIEKQELEEGLLDAARKLKDTGNIKNVKKKLRAVSFDGLDEDEIKTVNLFENKDERFKARKEKAEKGEIVFIPIGVKEFDEETKGPMPGQFFSFLGDTNVGKSALAVNVGKSGIIFNFYMWHIVVEDELDMTLQRYDTAFSGVSYDKFTYCDYSKEEKDRIDKIYGLLRKKRDKYLYVTKIKEGCTMAEIESEYERLKSVEGFHPDGIILDSSYNMDPIKRMESHRLNCGQVYREIRMFTRKTKVGVINFDQSKEDAKGKRSDTGAFSESYDKPRIADGFITINQTRLQKKEGKIELWVAKMKDRKKHVSYYIRPNMGIMRFDSITGGN